MGTFIVKRLFTLLPILLALSFLTFMLGNLSSGDAARVLAEKDYGRPTLEQIELVREKMGFNRPVLTQYFEWLGKALTGDLGRSYTNNKPVASEIFKLFPKTLQLAFWALFFSMLISFSLGILSAVFKDSWLDRIVRAYCFFTASAPQFWIALMALYFLGARLGLISVLGGSALKHPIVPALVVAFCMSDTYIRLIKTNMEEALSRGYIRAIRAKGVGEIKIVCVHALKSAALPALNKLGIGLGGLLAGSSVIESIFSWNGLGKYILESVKTKNFPVIQGYVLLMGIVIVILNLLVDVICNILDPRLISKT